MLPGVTAFFCCLELPEQTKRSVPLEAVEVGTTGLLSPLLRRYARLEAKIYIYIIDKNPYSKKKCARTPFARPEEKSERAPLVLWLRCGRRLILLQHRLAVPGQYSLYDRGGRPASRSLIRINSHNSAPQPHGRKGDNTN